LGELCDFGLEEAFNVLLIKGLSDFGLGECDIMLLVNLCDFDPGIGCRLILEGAYNGELV